MLTKSTVQLMALGLVGSFAATAAAQDAGALIDLMVRKGMLKDQEAEQVRAQLSRDYAANTPAGKLNLSSSVKELKLSGDVRVRGQYDTQDSQTGTVNGDQRIRYRVRLRINGDYKLNDNFTAGFGLQTTQNNDSGNQTMAGGTAGDYHQNYGVYINKAFIGWTPIAGLNVTGGKQVNPFYTTDMVWDADITPTGFSERVDLHKFLNLGPLELSLVGGQFVVSDNNENNVSGKTNRDAFIYQTQLIAAANVTEGIKVTVAPSFYCSNAASLFATTSDGGGEYNSSKWSGLNQLDGLKVVLLPGDVSFKVAGLPVKFNWDLAYNKDGTDRSALYGTAASTAASTTSSIVSASNAALVTAGYTRSTAELGGTGSGLYTYTKTTPGATTAARPVTSSSRDDLAYLVGFVVGENKKKGDWSLAANYRQVGLSAVDPNINDSDWALSYTNMSGYKAGFLYSLGDATTIGATYYQGDNLRKDLGVIGASAGPGSGKNSVNVLQVDVQVKF
jgi:polyhydroxyalkanoate synthesis regulator phasin